MEGKGSGADVVVVGAGLAGLAASALLARRGREVVVLERSREPGGRARTVVENGFHLNLGPHALYLEGTGAEVLRELDAWPEGGRPDTTTALGLTDGRLARLPSGPGALLTTRLLSPVDRAATAWALWRALRAEPGELEGQDQEVWLRRICPTRGSRALLEALIRLTTYADDSGLAADAASAKLRDGLEGVVYPDGGWQSIVDALVAAGEAEGVDLRTSRPVRGLEVEERRVRGVRVDGELVPARCVLLALPLEAAAELMTEHVPGMEFTARKALPARLATLDLGLSSLPRPDRTFVLGIDRPLYFSVHSAVAELAPEGGAVVHASRYLGPGERADAGALEEELEAFMTRIQPGWRDVVEARQFLPSMTVASDTPRGNEGGLPARRGPAIPELHGLFVAGDWVGPEGLLSDASLTSASNAARRIEEALASSASA